MLIKTITLKNISIFFKLSLTGVLLHSTIDEADILSVSPMTILRPFIFKFIL